MSAVLAAAEDPGVSVKVALIGLVGLLVATAISAGVTLVVALLQNRRGRVDSARLERIEDRQLEHGRQLGHVARRTDTIEGRVDQVEERTAESARQITDLIREVAVCPIKMRPNGTLTPSAGS